MGPEIILARLRQLLLAITAGVFLMTAAELFFLGHWNEVIQLLPFVLCGLGLMAVGLAYFRPTRSSLKFVRGAMILIGLCSLIGFYEYMSRNYQFWLELYPHAAAGELVKATLEGEFPVMAPGILLLGAVIGLAAVYQHPLLDT